MSRMTFDPNDYEAFAKRRTELVDDFANWLEPLQVDVSPDDFRLLLDWKLNYADGHLGRWSSVDVEEFLLDWCPRKLSGPAELMRGVPSAVALGMSFLAERGLHSRSAPTKALVEHAMSLQDRFMDEMVNPANFGLAKSVFGHLDIDDPSSLDPQSLQQAMDEFNALPFEERRAITDPAIGAPNESLPSIGLVMLPDDDAVWASARSAPVLEGFAKLADYLSSPGKQLTARGNLKIADARALAELLDTADVYEEQFGDHTFRKRSAADFIELDHWQWWARETGAIRQRGNKLVGVKAWQQRLKRDPVDEARRALTVLTEYGPMASYSTRIHTPLNNFLDESTGILLARLLQKPGPSPYNDLLEGWSEVRASAGVDEYYPGELDRGFDRLLRLLERSGLVAQEGAVHTSRKYVGTARSGGTVQLTPLGVVLGVEALREHGIPVNVLPSASEMTVAELVDVAEAGALAPDRWWGMASNWIALQPQVRASIIALVEELCGRSAMLLTIALGAAPEAQWPMLTPALKEHAFKLDQPPGETGSLAMAWLLQNGIIDDADVDPALVFSSVLVTMGVLADDDPASVVDMLSQSHTGPEQLELIAAVGQQLPPHALDLLEAIGAHHGDKLIAKAARKESFRVRSRLSNRNRQQ